MPALVAFLHENDHEHGKIQRKAKLPLPISMAKVKYNAFIRHLKGRNHETKSILLKNTTKSDKVRKLLIKLLPRNLPSAADYPKLSNTTASDRNEGFCSSSNYTQETQLKSHRGKAKISEIVELETSSCSSLNSPRTSNIGETSEIIEEEDINGGVTKMGHGHGHDQSKNRLRYKGRRQDNLMAFKVASKPTFSLFNHLCKKKLTDLSKNKRIAYHSSNGNINDGGISTTNGKIKEEEEQGKRNATSAKARKKVHAKRDEGDELWKKNILIGARCQMLDFNGALQYDERGEELKLRKSQLPSENMGLSFHMGEGQSDLPTIVRRWKRRNQFLDLISKTDGERDDSHLAITSHANQGDIEDV